MVPIVSWGKHLHFYPFLMNLLLMQNKKLSITNESQDYINTVNVKNLTFLIDYTYFY